MGFAVRRDQSYNVVAASASVDGFMDLSLALRQAKTAYAARFLNDTALVGLEEMKLYHLIQGRYWLMTRCQLRNSYSSVCSYKRGQPYHKRDRPGPQETSAFEE